MNREAGDWFLTVLRSIADGVIATDVDARVVFLNRAAEELTGWSQAEALHKPVCEVLELIDERTGKREVWPAREAVATGEPVLVPDTTRLVSRSGRQFFISDVASPIRDDQGAVSGAVIVFRDITKARVTSEQLQRALAAARMIAWEYDGEHDRISVTGPLAELYGLAPGSTLERAEQGLPLVHPEDRERHRAMVEKAVQERGSYVSQFRIIRPDNGAAVWIEERGESGAEDGKLHGVSFDITARKQADEERERLLAAAETANRMKDDFLATLSHELRTPLNAIVGWAKILRSGKVDAEDLEEGLSAIDRNSQAQTQIIEDLLDISRIISGNLRLDVQRLNLTDVIEAALAAVLPAATAKEIRIHKVLDSLAGPVTGDAARLQQVVWNLLSNAVKFTPRGGRVQVLLERVNSHVEISVIDTGIGIQPEFLPHVFDRFRQADASTTRRHAGLGLGLAIVKQLIEMHGGTIRAKSPGEGQGATFTVTLPIVVVHPERPEPSKVRPKEREATEDVCPNGALAGLKVLVVDDEPDARQLLRRVLGDCQAQVAVASSSAEALAIIGPFRPDVIVCDIGMPEQDGYDLIHRVRADPATREIPAAALTAFARPEDRKRSLLAGFQTHVAKPVDPAELTAVVASLVFRTGQSDQHQGGQP